MKENFIFGGAPNFSQLKADDRCGKNQIGTMSIEEMKEFSDEQKKKKKSKSLTKKKLPQTIKSEITLE